MRIHKLIFFQLRLYLVLMALAVPAIAAAAPVTFNVDGVITKPDGSALEEPTVVFQIDIKSPAASGGCLLYREQSSVTMTSSGGYFSIPVGTSANLASGGYTLSQVLGNEGSLTSLVGCTSGSSYTPGADDDRQVVISFTDSSGSHNFSSQTIKAVPFAIRAKTAESISGFSSGSLLKVDSTVSQTLNANTALSQAQYDEFWRLVKNPSSGIQSSAAITQTRVESVFSRYSVLDAILNGTFAGNAATATALATAPGACPAGQYMTAMSATGTITCGVPAVTGGTVTNVSSANAYLAVASNATTPVLTLNVGTAANTVAAGDDARFTDSRAPSGTAAGDLSGSYPNPKVAKISGKSVVLTTPAAGEFLKYDGTNFVNATVPADSTKLPLAGGTMSGAIDMNSQNLINVGFMTMSPNKSLHLSNNASDPSGLVIADKGKMWFDSTNGVIKFWNGTTAQSLGVAGSGISTFNTQTGSTQTLAIGTSGTAPAWNSATNTHTLNIPMASTASVTAGLLSKTDYDAFTAKLGPSTTFSGDVSGAYNATSVDKIKGKSVSTGAYSTGQVLKYDGTTWTNSALNFSDLSGRPTTIAGYGITDAQSNTLADGKIFVGSPANVAAPVIMSGDATLSNTGALTLATVPITKGGTGLTSFAGDKLVTTSAAGALQTSSCALGQVISFTAGGAFTCATVLSNSTAFTGDVSGTASTTSVDKIKGKSVSTSIYVAGQVLRYDGSNWANVALNFSDLAAKPTTVLGYGITDAMSNSLANGTIWVGNGSGVAAPVTMSGDATISNAGVLSLAAVPVAKGGTGTNSFSANKLVTTTTGGALQSSSCSLNQVMSFDASGIFKCAYVSEIANVFLDGGNSPNAAMTLGTITAQNLNFSTSGTSRMTITSDGNVGVGTATPSSSSAMTVNASGSMSGLKVLTNTSAPVNPSLVVTNSDATGLAANFTGGVKITGTTTVAGTFVVDAVRQPAAVSVTGSAYTIPDLSKSVVRIHLTGTLTITLPPTTLVPADQMYTLIVKVKQDSSTPHTLGWNTSVGDTVVWDTTGSGSPSASRTGFYRFFTVGGDNVWYASTIYK